MVLERALHDICRHPVSRRAACRPRIFERRDHDDRKTCVPRCGTNATEGQIRRGVASRRPVRTMSKGESDDWGQRQPARLPIDRRLDVGKPFTPSSVRSSSRVVAGRRPGTRWARAPPPSAGSAAGRRDLCVEHPGPPSRREAWSRSRAGCAGPRPRRCAATYSLVRDLRRQMSAAPLTDAREDGGEALRIRAARSWSARRARLRRRASRRDSILGRLRAAARRCDYRVHAASARSARSTKAGSAIALAMRRSTRDPRPPG